MRRNSFWQPSRAAVFAVISAVAVSLASGETPFRAADPDPRASTTTTPNGVTSPAGGLQDAQQNMHEYRIGPGDVLGIEVWKEPDASSPTLAVRPDGRVSLPMLGEMTVTGLTPNELERQLAAKFGELIRGARVTVSVRETNSQKIYLIGEVKKEGPVRMQAPMTVLQALAEAGGVTDFAKRHKIYILRTDQGRRLILPFDYPAVVRGEKMQQNILLFPGDTVVVPR